MKPPICLMAFALTLGLSAGARGEEFSEIVPLEQKISILPLATGSHGDFFAEELPSPQRYFTSLEEPAPPVPATILEFVARYPQAESFARNYALYYDKQEPIDLTQELGSEGIPLFIQWDPRWGYQTYGSNYLGVNGCGPTCISMISCGLTHDGAWNPLAVARWSAEHGYYVTDVGTDWGLMVDTQAFGLRSYAIYVEDSTIRGELSSGHPVVLSVSPGDFTYVGHFILLEGLNPDGTVRLNDPNSPHNSAIPWDLSQVLSQTVAAWAFMLA